MGNRAVITTKEKETAIYLHWNGGRDSVEAFLKYCELRGFRSPDQDTYGWARLTQIIANFFGKDGYSLGIGSLKKIGTRHGDNGIYIIENWKIIAREGLEGEEQTSYKLQDMLNAINNAQPKEQRLTKRELTLKIGD